MTMDLETTIKLPNGVEYQQPIGLFINNEFVKPSKESTITSVSPATGKDIAKVYAASEEDVDKAVAAARKAFDEVWCDVSGTERGTLLGKFADLIEENGDLIAAIDSFDNGKAFSSAKGDVAEGIKTLRYYAGFADKSYGKTIETDPSKFAYTVHEPMGVCALILPFNYPFLLSTWKLGPAIATGNCVIMKSAEQTPLSLLFLATLAKKVFPPGVVNIFSGYGKVAGAAMASHMGIDKVSFTGSTATGRLVLKAATANLKNVTLELGGKSPSLIFEDADLKQAVKWSHDAIMQNQGEICCATSRVYVQEGVYDEFLAELIKVTKTTKVGDPFEEETFFGAQVSEAQHQKVLGYIEAGVKAGAKVEFGGKRHGESGFFIEPTIFSNVSKDMSIVKEEIFGPVVAVGKFGTEAEAIQLANDTSYGLGAAIFTTNLTRAHKLARKITAGSIWINSSGDSDYRIPFPGLKSSGFGGSDLGPYALEVYTQIKAVHVNLGL